MCNEYDIYILLLILKVYLLSASSHCEYILTFGRSRGRLLHHFLYIFLFMPPRECSYCFNCCVHRKVNNSFIPSRNPLDHEFYTKNSQRYQEFDHLHFLCYGIHNFLLMTFSSIPNYNLDPLAFIFY